MHKYFIYFYKNLIKYILEHIICKNDVFFLLLVNICSYFGQINSNLATINATGLTKIGAVPWKDIIITNSGQNAVVFFSNWTGEKCFPENYGSGIILPCVDVTHKRILYIGRSGKLYTGFFFVSDKDNITWYS